MTRVDVRKTYKLFIGGDFPRSESGRSYEVVDGSDKVVANAVRASRKDVRDAVVAARRAQPGWQAATAYNRGQVLYRVAEMIEGRAAELADAIALVEGKRGARKQVEGSIDTWVWYAGLADKVTQVAGGLNQVAGPYFNITSPEPTGVIGVVAPDGDSVAVLSSRLAAALCGGNSVVALASETNPLPAIVMAECIATADVPSGVVNILTGRHDELVMVLADHGDVDGLDVTGVPADMRVDVEAAAAVNVKRVVSLTSERSPYEATKFMEMKTVWHPKGA